MTRMGEERGGENEMRFRYGQELEGSFEDITLLFRLPYSDAVHLHGI